MILIEFVFQANFRNFRSAKYSKKSQYAGKVKCYTLKPAQNPPNSSESRLMLGLKDPKVDSCCEYEPKPVVTKQKKRPKIDFHNRDRPGAKRSGEIPKFVNSTAANVQHPENKDYGERMTENKDFDNSNIFLDQGENQVLKGEKKAEKSKEIENSITFYSPSEQNEENSKDFMGSIGSWINDLFSVPNKRICAEQKIIKPEIQKEQSLDEDPEYLKSISAIKEQFRKKLKNETSVHLSTSDKPFEYHFFKVLDNSRKSNKMMKSLPSSKSTEILEELNNLNYENLDEKMNQNQSNFPLKKENITQSLNTASMINLVKKKRKISRKSRSESSTLEEYVLPSASELSKKILLNINDQDKSLQFYKNPQVGVQEAQHYNLRKSKPCQFNTRCYTTNANVTESAENSLSKPFIATNRPSDCFTSDNLELKGEDEFFTNKHSLDAKKPLNRKLSGKNSAEYSRDMLTLIKAKSPKSLYNPHSEFLRNELKISSDELVRHLMKKVKVNARPQQRKKSSLNMAAVVNSPKSRFMQSATNTLVMSAMARKENELRLPTDSKLTKTPVPSKDMAGNVRFDVSRALNQNKFNKSSYVLESDRDDEDFFFGISNYRNAKQMNDTMKRSDKIPKRHELKHMLAKLDTKINSPNSPKPKQKEKSKQLKNVFEEFEAEDCKDSSNPRFFRQHERFKNNIKTAQQNSDAVFQNENQEKKIEEAQTTAGSTETALVNTDVQMTLANLREKNVVVTQQPVQVFSEPEETKATELLPLDESNTKSEKKTPIKSNFSRDRFRTSPHKYFKENSSNSVLKALPKYCSSELQSQKEPQCEPPLCPPDLHPTKSMEKLFLNRRFSTNTLTAIRRNKRAPLVWQPVKHCTTPRGTSKEPEGGKREGKEKEKPKNSNKNENNDKVCGFEKIVKKPGPNCKNEENNKV